MVKSVTVEHSMSKRKIYQRLCSGFALATLVMSGSTGAGLSEPVVSEAPDSVLRISPQQAMRIGQRIWQNEGAGKVENLIVWNEGEDFPSLGIGHFIWYPAGVAGPFVESFPDFLDYLAQTRPLPPWLTKTAYAPWPDRTAFFADMNSTRMDSLRDLLQSTITEQTRFIIRRLQAALPRLLAAASGERQRQHIRRQFNRVAATARGIYALVDYVNFKGEGLSEQERYQGHGWGLFQVLDSMRPDAADAIDEFIRAANEVLTRRVANAERDETQWLPGWRRRLETYRQD
jgi:hypothetical protein